ncbi:hypothetical protein [Microcoleus sp. CAWBG24]|nr:hypothetical protein [Microcoleus sp. CAWBG24]
MLSLIVAAIVQRVAQFSLRRKGIPSELAKERARTTENRGLGARR